MIFIIAILYKVILMCYLSFITVYLKIIKRIKICFPLYMISIIYGKLDKLYFINTKRNPCLKGYHEKKAKITHPLCEISANQVSSKGFI